MPTPLELFEQYDQSSTPSISSTEESNNILTPLSLFESYEKGITPEGVATSELAPIKSIVDPNSTANKWDIATDQAGEMFYDGAALFAAKIGADDLAADLRKTSDEYKQSAASKPQPEISMSITEEAPKIYDKFSEGEVLEAITDTADFVHSVLVGVAPSMLATGAAVGAAAVAKPVMLGIGAGALASNLTAAVIGMTPSMVMSSGQVYEDALKYGASKEDAENIGIGAGSVVGFLDRLGFTALLSGLAGKLGKETTIKAIKEQTDLSESMIREAVNKAVKGGGRGLKIEGATEAAQTIVEETSPALVSEKEVELANLVPKVIDSFAAGGIGGGFVGAMTGAISVPVARQAIKQAEEQDLESERLQRDLQEQGELFSFEEDLGTIDTDLDPKVKSTVDKKPRDPKEPELDLGLTEEAAPETGALDLDEEAILRKQEEDRIEEARREIERDESLIDPTLNEGTRERPSDATQRQLDEIKILEDKESNKGTIIVNPKVRALEKDRRKLENEVTKLKNQGALDTDQSVKEKQKEIDSLTKLIDSTSRKKLREERSKLKGSKISDKNLQKLVEERSTIESQNKLLEEKKKLNDKKKKYSAARKAGDKKKVLTKRDKARLNKLTKQLKGSTLKKNKKKLDQISNKLQKNADAKRVDLLLNQATEERVEFTKEDKARLDELNSGLKTREDVKNLRSLFKNVVSRSTTKLRELSKTVPIAGQMINELMNIEFNNNQGIGRLFNVKELINDKLRKAYKLPFQSTISMDLKNQVTDQLNGYKEATDSRARQVAIEIKKEIYDKIYYILRASGIEMGKIEEYLPTIYKFRMKGLGRSKDIAKFKEILKRNKVLLAEKGLDPTEIIENIITNDGVYIPDPKLDIFNTKEDTDPQAVRRGFEKERSIPREVVQQLSDAGLVEKDFDKVTNKYIVDSVRRANLNRFVTKYKPVINELYQRGLMTESEGKRIKDIVDALQSRYRTIDNLGLRSLFRFTNSLAYILTLPLAGITALTEPLIVLHRVNPKNAIYGLMNAAEVGLRKGVRAFAPQFKRSENEQALLSLMQTADLALVNAQRDISDVSINKKVTDTFFKVNMLAQVTQFSRYMAYFAGRQQLRDDIKLIQKEELLGEPTAQTRKARKRLELLGLANIVPKVNRKADTVEPPTAEQREVLDWFGTVDRKTNEYIEGMDEATTPAIITKALGKLVDEVIMTPNVVNKPLWMSNPYLAPVAQLKGFMMVFGNTVGMRMYKDVFKPLFKGRVPAGEIMKYAMTFTLLTSAIMGTQVLKNVIRYGDDEAPYDKLEGWEKLWTAIVQSNIFGFGNVFLDALNSQKYGNDPLTQVAGPTVSKVSGLLKAAGSGSPQRIATALAKVTPGLASLPADRRKGITEPVAEFIEDIID